MYFRVNALKSMYVGNVSSNSLLGHVFENAEASNDTYSCILQVKVVFFYDTGNLNYPIVDKRL